ncbi:MULTISPECIES: UDP-N-acetylmuramate dehydrogenase [Thalassospira]|uniref:UDP-N-acetylenolpyruvoylglucosamine reductase n=1 Tax=Thalassospira profundimaris TaxID=502049 RepID=A0A367VKC2_9PROT|nr:MULTISPECIES: UDP-N-acetylmuramate dehydrogenase [Thalassospira]KZB70706.1 UDP-N-acetylenolpyruvoylglucosamine reductase [Thalassospira sp. MCCC 1A01148]MBR9899609.1 UDP-N-acetylmuramate dehydrogenase [Rhodospirillales bacterium]RCK25665.1 UDP-N-acetylenolpyruvoylglucosamine reductase [Thalassospira profundimaris]
MSTPKHHTPLIDRLPKVRGKLREGAQLAKVTWFQVGGPADVMFRPEDEADLADFLKGKPEDLPVTVIGVGSNLLVRDGGIRGVVVRLGRPFTDVVVEDGAVHAGAGALDLNVAQTAQMNGIAGLEFLSGIPGTIGGALRMNAGAYGTEIKDVLVSATAIDGSGNIHTVTPDEMNMTYRHCSVPEDWIFTSAILRASSGDPEDIAKRMDEIQKSRVESQPIKSRTGGSTFANPVPKRAWEVIDAAGCRGLKIGGAQMSEQHCNFMINTGNATALDLEQLGDEVRRRVKEHSGVELRWEIRRIGERLGHSIIGKDA